MTSGASCAARRFRFLSLSRTELMFQVTSEKAMRRELEHEAGSADNAERPAAGGEQLELGGEGASRPVAGEQREAALMTGLGGGTGGDLGQRRVSKAGAGERRCCALVQAGRDVGERGQRGEQRLQAETAGALAPQRLFVRIFGLPPVAAPIGSLGDRRSLAPTANRRDRTRRQAERDDIGLGSGDHGRGQRGTHGGEPRQGGNRGGKSGKFGEGGVGWAAWGNAHAASATSGSLSLRWPSTRSRTRFRKSARMSSLVRCLMPYLR